MAAHSDVANLIPVVLGLHGLWPFEPGEPVAGGTLNWNFSVHTDGGRKFVRRYRHDIATDRIRGEHDLLFWLAERGVPVAVANETPGGATIVDVGSGRWAVFEWVEGEVPPRGSLTRARALMLGRAHGRLQELLAGHPLSSAAVMSTRWDKGESLALLERVRDSAARDADRRVQAVIAKQVKALELLEVLPPEAFAALPAQLLHGDFHDQQVIWQGESIVAIVDWEMWKTDVRVWELVRSLAFSNLLDSPLMEEYLAGYREHIRLSEEECRLGLRLWWQSRLVGLWVWAAYFLQGNERVRSLFPAAIEDVNRATDEPWKAALEDRFVRAALAR
ncbi:MAG: phosphotransferase [Dehalococcoidia bacterium]|nr:phosphotransferase [Dehalococcoidia bacterium]